MTTFGFRITMKHLGKEKTTMETPDSGYSAYHIYDMFDEALDNRYAHVFIYNNSYSPSEILKTVDPKEYLEAFEEWCKLMGYAKDPTGTFDFIQL